MSRSASQFEEGLFVTRGYLTLFGSAISMKECLGQIWRWFGSIAKPPGLVESGGMCSSMYACDMKSCEKFTLVISSYPVDVSTKLLTSPLA